MKKVSGPENLLDLAELCMDLACSANNVPNVERIGFVSHWAIVELSDGRAGRAFVFNGPHAVYGALDFEWMRAKRGLIGLSVDEAFTLLSEEDCADAATASLNHSLILALINSLSSELNMPSNLRERGFDIGESSDVSFFHPDDKVVLIGAGMLLKEASSLCSSVDVLDMRPRASLQSLLLDADGERYGPANVRFHSQEKTQDLLAQADVIGITGCTLVNESMFEIANMPRKAREFIAFGPSAQAPMELFEQMGFTKVVTSRIVRATVFMDSVLAGFQASKTHNGTEDYLVRFSSNTGIKGEEAFDPV